MLIHELMSRPVVTSPSNCSIASVYGLMTDRGIRHIPIFDETLVGIVTDRDLRRATSSLHASSIDPARPVSEVMIQTVTTASPLDPVEEAARLMRQEKIGCLPVLSDDDLVGIVTGMDLLDALIRLTGLGKPSARLEIRLQDEPGRLADLTSIVSEMGVNIHSLLTYPQDARFVHVILRLNTIHPHPVSNRLRQAGYEVVWPAPKPWSQ
jgi:acetoin utilization protein AcuB